MAHPKTDVGAHVTPRIGTPVLADTGSTVNGTGIDRTTINTPLSVALVAQAGAVTGGPSAQTFDAKIQDSPDNSAWADFTDSNSNGAITQQTADDAIATERVNLNAADRYIRAVTVVALTGGTSPTWPVSTALVFGGVDTVPTA